MLALTGKFRKALLPAAAALAVGGALLLAGCGEAPQEGEKPASAGGPAGYEPRRDTLKDDYFMTVEIPVTTRDGRNLLVTAFAYCEKSADKPLLQYKADCTAHVTAALTYLAEDRDNFEAVIPTANPEIRRNALFPPEVMRRTLEMSAKDNLYTVTAIRPR